MAFQSLMPLGTQFWLLAAAGAVFVHFAAYALAFRRLLSSERGIVVYQALPGIALLVFLAVKGGADPTQAAGAAAFYGIYSLAFLGLWASSDGGYSLRILAHIERAGRAGMPPDFSDLRKLGDHKKLDRIRSLKRLGLVRARGEMLGLTVMGQLAAACLAEISWLCSPRIRS